MVENIHLMHDLIQTDIHNFTTGCVSLEISRDSWDEEGEEQDGGTAYDCDGCRFIGFVMRSFGVCGSSASKRFIGRHWAVTRSHSRQTPQHGKNQGELMTMTPDELSAVPCWLVSLLALYLAQSQRDRWGLGGWCTSCVLNGVKLVSRRHSET